MSKNLSEKVKALVKPQYNQLSCWTHSWPHISNVRDISLVLAEKEKRKKKLAEIAAYCHDLGRISEEQNKGGEHAILSIEPTIKVLEQIGFNDPCEKGLILEAVASHSQFIYGGKNPYAKILRDADKIDALSSFGILKTIRFTLKRDLVPTKLILENLKDLRILEDLVEESLSKLRGDNFLRKKYLEAVNFVAEWIEEKTFDLDSTYEIFSDKMRYFLEIRKRLI